MTCTHNFLHQWCMPSALVIPSGCSHKWSVWARRIRSSQTRSNLSLQRAYRHSTLCCSRSWSYRWYTESFLPILGHDPDILRDWCPTDRTTHRLTWYSDIVAASFHGCDVVLKNRFCVNDFWFNVREIFVFSAESMNSFVLRDETWSWECTCRTRAGCLWWTGIRFWR